MRKIITYAIDTDTGFVVSRVGQLIVCPTLDYRGMTPENDFATRYNLEASPVTSVAATDWWKYRLIWTKKIPLEVKNFHRQFWGMSQLKGAT